MSYKIYIFDRPKLQCDYFFNIGYDFCQ